MMSALFDFLIVGWCTSYLLAAVGLMIWLGVELKHAVTQLRARRKSDSAFPRALAVSVPVAKNRVANR